MPALRLLRLKLLWVWGVFIILLAACRPVATPTSTPTRTPIPTPTLTPTPEWERAGWTLVWHDEFDGETINPDNWAYDLGGGGWGNNERQFYTARPENARIEEGLLVIEARAERYLQSNYTSARLKTQGLHAWAYGRIEARMQLPYGNGIWPAFWMLGTDFNQVGWPTCGEIDIMEHIGREATKVYGTVHGPGYSGGNGVGSSTAFSPGALSEAFHTYAIEWDPQEIRWYADEKQYFTVTPGVLPGMWVYDHPFSLTLNLAVGGNWPGYPDETTVFPQNLRVDYVRVYQKPELAGEYTGQPGKMHLGEINVTAQENSDGSWQAVATITVVNEDGDPVEGARLKGGWVGEVTNGETEAQTDAAGTVRLTSAATTRTGTVTFCVTSVTHSIHTYDKSANARNCGEIVH